MATLQEIKGGNTVNQSGMSLAQITGQPSSTQSPEKDGFFKSVAKGVAKLPLRVGSSLIAPTYDALKGRSMEEIAKRNAEGRQMFGMNIKPLGYQASAVGRGDMTVGQGAVNMAKDIAGAQLEVGSYFVPAGKAGTIAKNTFGGAVGRGALQGLKTGAASGFLMGAGTEMQDENSTVGSVAKNAAVGTVIGGAAGGALGGVLAAPAAANRAVRGVTSGEVSSGIMQRVARINPADERKFVKMAGGDTPGEYLVKRGIYGSDEEIVQTLAKRYQTSRQAADDALADLGGTWKDGSIEDVLSELLAREKRVSTKNVQSPDLNRVTELNNKYNAEGLTMSEVNELKRLYERNVRLGYLKEQNADAISRSTNLDSALRTWQFAQAKKLGMQNLPELNKETQLAKNLGDSLYKKMVGSSANNAVSLTDAVLLSGGDPQAVAMFLTRKSLGSKKVQSSIAKTLAPEPTIGQPAAIMKGPITDESRLLPPASGADTSINQGRPIPVMPAGRAGEYTGAETVAYSGVSHAQTPTITTNSIPNAIPNNTTPSAINRQGSLSTQALQAADKEVDLLLKDIEVRQNGSSQSSVPDYLKDNKQAGFFSLLGNSSKAKNIEQGIEKIEIKMRDFDERGISPTSASYKKLIAAREELYKELGKPVPRTRK